VVGVDNAGGVLVTALPDLWAAARPAGPKLLDGVFQSEAACRRWAYPDERVVRYVPHDPETLRWAWRNAAKAWVAEAESRALTATNRAETAALVAARSVYSTIQANKESMRWERRREAVAWNDYDLARSFLLAAEAQP